MTQQEPTQQVDGSHEMDRDAWGMLVSMNQEKIPNIELFYDTLMMGRKHNCDVRFNDPKVSSKHCRIVRTTTEVGTTPVFIEDYSSNGTFLNGTRIGKGERRLLRHGDQISLVHARPAMKSETVFIGFVFHEAEYDGNAQGSVYIEPITKEYEVGKVLGTGNFAEVRVAVHKQTGKHVAIKIIDKSKFAMKPKVMANIMAEVEILKNLDHEGVISYIDFYDEDKYMLYLVIEYVGGGDLFSRLERKQRYTEKEARELFLNLLEALFYLHSNGVAHRDLKPENILMVSEHDDTRIKLTDFGLAKVLGSDTVMTTVCGTPQYVAPEVLRNMSASKHHSYGVKCDLWSCGVILYVLLSGIPPFYDGSGRKMLDCIKRGDYDFPRDYFGDVSDDAKDIISCLLTVDPRKRISIEEAYSHPWLQTVAKPSVKSAMSLAMSHLDMQFPEEEEEEHAHSDEEEDDAEVVQHDADEEVREPLVARTLKKLIGRFKKGSNESAASSDNGTSSGEGRRHRGEDAEDEEDEEDEGDEPQPSQEQPQDSTPDRKRKQPSFMDLEEHEHEDAKRARR